jgi:hypothetical protein
LKIRQTLIFIASLAVASIALNTSLHAQCAKQEAEPTAGNMYCVSSYEQLLQETGNKEQTLAFAGITRTGLPLWFFKSDTGFTVFFKSRLTGKYCTAPNYFGKIINVTPIEEQELGDPI